MENEGKQEVVILEERRHTHNAQRCWRCSGTACAGLLSDLNKRGANGSKQDELEP